MRAFSWRWARAGDRVTVHGVAAPHPLRPGVIAQVQRAGQHTYVAIRLDDDEGRVQYLPRQFVHAVPADPTEPCGLCAERTPTAGYATAAP